MNIFINDKEIEVISGETLLEAAKRVGCEIPALCYAKGFVHKSSCMVCAVKNQTNGQILPSCTTYPEEGMRIETDSEEVHKIRILSLELLLSDHRADCEAPCSLVCPKGLDVEQMLRFYDAGFLKKACQLVSNVFPETELACDACKAPCEKACRRGTVDNAVSIREIIKEVKEWRRENGEGRREKGEWGREQTLSNPKKMDKNVFQSRLGRFTVREKERLKSAAPTPSRCLHCACVGRDDCKLRLYATSEGIKRPRFDSSSTIPAMITQSVNGNIQFEPAKCIRCGLCVYNSKNGFTFKDRGFGVRVVLPEENRKNIREELVTLCPTGALYLALSL